MRFAKPLYLALGWFSIALGVLGIIMPILPTTPFLLVAVWAFSRSSPVMAAKIRAHPTFGPPIRNWQDHGVIPIAGKIAAVFMMSLASAYLVGWSPAPWWAAWIAVAVMVAVGIYVVTRPSKAES